MVRDLNDPVKIMLENGAILAGADRKRATQKIQRSTDNCHICGNVVDTYASEYVTTAVCRTPECLDLEIRD